MFPLQTAKLILAGEIPALPTHLSAACRDFIRQALTKDPRQRPSAKQLLQHSWIQHCMAPVGGNAFASGVERSLASGLPAIRSASSIYGGDHGSVSNFPARSAISAVQVCAVSAGASAAHVPAVSPVSPKTPGRISDSSGPGATPRAPRRTPSSSGPAGVQLGAAALKDLHDRQLHRRNKERATTSSGPKQQHTCHVQQQQHHSHHVYQQPQLQQSAGMPVAAQPRAVPCAIVAARNARVITDSPVASKRPSHSGQTSNSEHSGLSPTTPTTRGCDAPSNAHKRAVQAARNLLNIFESDSSFILKDHSGCPTDCDAVSGANSDCGAATSFTYGGEQQQGYSRLKSDLGQHCSSSGSLDTMQYGVERGAPSATELGLPAVAARCSSVTLPKTHRAAPDSTNRHSSCNGAVDSSPRNYDSHGVSAAVGAGGAGCVLAWQVQVQTPAHRPATSKSRFAR